MSITKPQVNLYVGGSGKWMATYDKKMIIDAHNRALLREHGETARQRPEWNRLPTNIAQVSVDVTPEEATAVEILDPFSEEPFSLDYSEASHEFVAIGSEFHPVIESIAAGNGERDYPRIARWFSREDARLYDLDILDKTTDKGAGQLRQLGRLSLFLNLTRGFEISDAIAGAIRHVSALNDEGHRIQIAVKGSIAGGTGSGIAFDVAALAHHHASAVIGNNYDVIGYIVLPTSFANQAARGSVESERMDALGYASLRELSRLVTSPGGQRFTYDTALDIELAQSLFQVTYLIEGHRPDGKNLAGVAPQYGSYPAVSTDTLFHAVQTVDYTQVKTNVAARPLGAFSALGTTVWILPVEEMIHEFGHITARLVVETLRFGHELRSDADESAAEVSAGKVIADRDTVIESAENTKLMRWLPGFVGQPTKSPLRTGLLFDRAQFNDRDIDRSLPIVILTEDIEIAAIGSVGDPKGVKTETDELIAKSLGGRNDSVGAGQNTVHAVLNLYTSVHRERFADLLESVTLESLNAQTGSAPEARPGGLIAATALIGSLSDFLQNATDRLMETYREQNLLPGENRTYLDRALDIRSQVEEQMLAEEGPIRDRMNNRGEQRDFLEISQEVYDLSVQDLVYACVVAVLEDWRRQLSDRQTQLAGWATTLREDRHRLASQTDDIRRRRVEGNKVRVHRYLSEPGRFEDQLFDEKLGGVDSTTDRTRSEVVDDLRKQISWRIEGEDLLLVAPTPAGTAPARRTVDWRAEGLPMLMTTSKAAFGSLREMTVWDALHRHAESATKVSQDLTVDIGLLTTIDEAEQGRNPAFATDHRTFVLARWEQSQEGDSKDSPRMLAQTLGDLLESQGHEICQGEDPHTLVATAHAHLLKLSSVNSAERMRKPYLRLLRGDQTVEGVTDRVPLHVFPGEGLAAELEDSSLQLLNEAVSIPPSLVHLLEREPELFEFALLLMKCVIAPHHNRRDNTTTWRLNPSEVGQEESGLPASELAASANGALTRFLDPDTGDLRVAKQNVVADLWESIEAMADTELQDALIGFSRTGFIDDPEPGDEADLDRMLRLLARRRASAL